MDIARRFVFRGNAAAIGGRINRPRNLIIEAGGASSLTVSGGRSLGRLPRTRFGEVVSVRSAVTSAEGVFDDRRQARELTYGHVREDSLTTTTTVKVDVRQLAIASDPPLRIEELRATMTGRSPRDGEEPSITPRDLRIAGVNIGGHTLLVEFDKDVFAKYDTRSRLLAAAKDPAFVDQHGATLLGTGGPGGPAGRPALMTSADGTIYTTVVKRLRWKGERYPESTIDHHLVVVPGLGRIYFGELFITDLWRRLTLFRARLGSHIGGAVDAAEIETNGAWYP